MKRKLDDNDVPATINGDVAPPEGASFESLGLEARLLQAIAKQNYTSPTDVQSKAIPLTLSGKDVLVRSKTGSGKSAAYILPILQSILKTKSSSKKEKCISALILVPTKELASQITKAVASFTAFCTKDIRVVNLTQNVDETVQRTLLAGLPDIVVSTPSRVAQNLNNGTLNVEKLRHLVVDEADLVLSYGYEEDFQVISHAFQKGIQTSLMSATLTTEVDTLKGIFCRDPVVLDLKETAKEAAGVSQYAVQCTEEDKFLLAYVVFKLKLIKGKSIIFVADIDRCYRLKLFFEQFGISSCVLNSELPVNTRIHVVEQFNKNVYDIIIASDEYEVLGDKNGAEGQQTPKGINGVEVESHEKHGEETAESPVPKKRRKKPKRDKEYGISRGIDFQNVACVLNFDLPTSSTSYTHRIGRTARAGKTGMALSFIIPKSEHRQHKPTSIPSTAHDEDTLAAITADQKFQGREVLPYHFDMKQVNAFRYRMNDALRAVTSVAFRGARTRELRQELLKSEKLKRHFEENPEDERHLRHDGQLRTARIQSHLKHVPDYLMPAQGAKGMVKDVGFVGLNKPESEKNRLRKATAFKKGRGAGKRGSAGGGGGGGRRGDPLKTFKTGGRICIGFRFKKLKFYITSTLKI